MKTIARVARIPDSLMLSASIIEIKNTTDAELCDTKYFTPFIIESSLDPLNRIGIMHNIFTSRQTH